MKKPPLFSISYGHLVVSNEDLIPQTGTLQIDEKARRVETHMDPKTSSTKTVTDPQALVE